MENNNSGCLQGVLPLLGVAFIVLKLTDVIDWSWWWVLAPFWVGIVVVLIALVAAGGLAAVAVWMDKK